MYENSHRRHRTPAAQALLFRMATLTLALALIVVAGCTADGSGAQDGGATPESGSSAQAVQLDADGYYYSVEDVVLYLETYGTLPPNYITKSEAEELGWHGGSVERYQEGAAIGGDVFGNREGNLPRTSETYRECDIDTDGRNSRGAERLIYTDDGDTSNGCGPYYYTDDHYETFTEVEVQDGEVVFHD